MNSRLKIALSAFTSVLVIVFSIFLIPKIFVANLHYEQQKTSNTSQFPVTVDPIRKSITENSDVNAYLVSPSSPLQASTHNAQNTFWQVFSFIAQSIAESPWYQSLASVNSHFVTITPGMRKEQVVNAFSITLGWKADEKLAFLTAQNGGALPFAEGSFAPATYYVESGTTPGLVQAQVNARFTQDVLSHYGTTTQEKVPLNDALTIASIIQRETIGNDDMRLISGIIWNRLFANMNLQVDATLQYAKASTNKTSVWWPKVLPKDKYLKSPYNTYSESGLPPTPISNPSVAAILAALNPIKTPCLYYFNDPQGNFHCTETYKEHVALLRKVYGQGK